MVQYIPGAVSMHLSHQFKKIIPVLMEPKFYHHTERKIITYYRKSLGWGWCISALNASPAER